MKDQGTGKYLFAITRFHYNIIIKIPLHNFTITGVKKNVCYTKEFVK